MTKDEIIKYFNENHETQKASYDDDLYETLKKFNAEKVAEGLGVDKHRWYETSTIVFKIKADDGEFFLGVTACTGMFSEESGFSDICWDYGFEEMKPVTKISYESV